MAKYFALLLLGSAGLFALSGCGGNGGGSNSSTGSTGGTGSSVAAPSALSYSSPAAGVVGVAIASLSPTVTGTVNSYSISPALPAGLSLDTTSGVISGTPSAAAAQGSYTITATNAGGNTTFALTLTVNAASTVSGTAASGAPIAGATVTLKDAAGKSQTTTTAADGSFQIIVNSLTPPFLLSVSSGGTTLFGYAAQSGIANLTPYTSVALQSYYAAQDSDVATVFNSTLTPSSFPSSQQLALLVAPITTVLQPYLSNAGVAQPNQFDPFGSSFTANHTGFDQVLDRTTLNSSLLAFSVDDGSGSTAGAISSTVSIQVTAVNGSALGTVAVNTTTTNSTSGTTSSSQQAVPVGASGTQQAALAAAQSGVLTLLNNLAQLVATKGSAVTAADLSAYVDAGFLDEGMDGSAFITQLLSFLMTVPPGGTLTPSIYRVNKFNGSAETLDATLDLQITSAGVTTDEYIDDNDNPNYGMVFKQEANGGWAFYGQQTLADAHIDLVETQFYANSTGTPVAPTNTLALVAQVRVSQGMLTGASISGPADSLPDCSQTPSPLTQSSVTLMHDAGVYDGNQDQYGLSCTGTLTGAPPAGTAYSFDLTLASNGTTVQQGYTLNGATDDSGELTQINGSSRATFAASATVTALAGSTLTLSFTPPTTYPILYSYLVAFCQSAADVTSGGGSDIQGSLSQIPPGTDSGTITIPSQCDGAPLATLSISVNFAGVNGEQSTVQQEVNP